MAKYIDAEKLRKKIAEQMDSLPCEVGRGAGTITSKGYGMMQAFQIMRSIIDSLLPKQPKEICHKCIHHGKDDDYCYNPHGGMQRRINENGVYDCTGFCETEQEQPEVDLSEETITKEFHIINNMCFNEGIEGWQKEKLIARHFYELGKARKEE